VSPMLARLVRLLLIVVTSLACSRASYTQNLTIVEKGEKAKIVQIVASSGVKISLGSGVWLSDDGYVATCEHVVNVGESPVVIIQTAVDPYFQFEPSRIITANWERYDAIIVKIDHANDLAILKTTKRPASRTMLRLGDVSLGTHYEKAEFEPKLPDPGEAVVIRRLPAGLALSCVPGRHRCVDCRVPGQCRENPTVRRREPRQQRRSSI
jgi:Trypsin-like peptidase domain